MYAMLLQENLTGRSWSWLLSFYRTIIVPYMLNLLECDFEEEEVG
ncbi:hypothetical protein SOVF_137720 isoform B [Spinacia oleracea]|nr:hypothetical protein SOVF_137720 isoform B [Spinacia oleracea]